jgi:hypothetical protein
VRRSDDSEYPGLVLDRFWAVTHPRRRGLGRKYREDAPNPRALVAIYHGVLQDLIHVGEAFDWLLDESGDSLSEYLMDESSTMTDGVYVWEGEVKDDGCYDNYSGGYEADYYLDGNFRLATKEEWLDYVNGEHPWDPTLWISDEF